MRHGKVSGFPSSFYKLVQQLGRLNCDGTAPPGSNVYNVYMDLYSYVSLFLRIMQQAVPIRRKLELNQLEEVSSISHPSNDLFSHMD